MMLISADIQAAVAKGKEAQKNIDFWFFFLDLFGFMDKHGCFQK